MDAKIIQLDPLPVAFVRHTGPYNECKTAWDKLCTQVKKPDGLSPQFMGG